MYQHAVYEDYIRGSLADNVLGLDNWIQRKVVYNHTQGIDQEIWNIEHNMGVAPSVTVYVDRPIEGDENNKELMTPTEITIVDENNIKLTFDRPWSGIAQLVNLQSDSNVNEVNTTTTVSETLPMQISSNGEITIATSISALGSAENMKIKVIYTNALGNEITLDYLCDDQPNINSPWLDADTVVIRGKIYTVRSYTALTDDMTSGEINSGSTFRIESINTDADVSNTYQPINKNEVLMLLSSSPYKIVDKIKDQFIDVTNVTDQLNVGSFYYNEGEFFASDQIVNSIYPPITFR
jgi:hypothetical protein